MLSRKPNIPPPPPTCATTHPSPLATPLPPNPESIQTHVTRTITQENGRLRWCFLHMLPNWVGQRSQNGNTNFGCRPLGILYLDLTSCYLVQQSYSSCVRWAFLYDFRQCREDGTTSEVWRVGEPFLAQLSDPGSQPTLVRLTSWFLLVYRYPVPSYLSIAMVR